MQEPKKQEFVLLSSDEQDDSIDIRILWKTLRKWQWLILTILFVSAVIVAIISSQLPPIYQARARILIEKESPNVLTFQEIINENPADSDYFQTQLKILQSRPLAEIVLKVPGVTEQLNQEARHSPVLILHQSIGELQKFLGFRTPASHISEEAQSAAEEDFVIAQFFRTIKVSPVPQSRLVDIQATCTNPKLVAILVNTLIDAYTTQAIENKLALSREAGNWLQKELEKAQKKVIESEKALQTYNREHDILSVEDRQELAVQKLSEIETSLHQARVKRMAQEVRYKRIQNLDPEQAQTIPQVISDPLVRQLKAELLSLEVELAETLKKFRSQHPNVIAIQSQIESVQKQLDDEIQQIILSESSEYAMAVAEEEGLQKLLDEQKQAMQLLNEQSVQYSVLQRDVESNRRVYESLLQRVKETNVTERLATSNVQIVERAREPNFPTGPSKIKNVLFAIIGGLGLGIVLAFIGEALNDKITTPEEFEQVLDMRLLGILPKLSSKELHGQDRKITLENIVATISLFAPQTPASEAYRGLRTNILFSLIEQSNILLITSSGPSEGKSGITANLGITLARYGQNTLIIDCDFRKPTLGSFFNLADGKPGITDMLLEEKDAAHAIYSTDLPNLHIVPCGTLPPNPSELLGSQKMRHILHAFADRYDVILLDSPPITAVNDALLLSQIGSRVLFVVRAGRMKRDAVEYACKQLKNVGAHIIGGVLNGIDVRKNKSYYGYQYTQYYQEANGHQNVRSMNFTN